MLNYFPQPFPTPVVSSRKNTQAQGTIQLKIGFVPVDPASPPNYAAMFSEFQQLGKMTGLTLHSSVPVSRAFSISKVEGQE